MCVNTSFQSRAPKQQGRWWWERTLWGSGNTKQKESCKVYALCHSSTIQLLPTTLAHISLYLSEHRATPKCYHFILVTLTSHPAFPAWLLFFVLSSCHCSCYTFQIKAHCTSPLCFTATMQKVELDHLPALAPSLHEQIHKRWWSPAALGPQALHW